VPYDERHPHQATSGVDATTERCDIFAGGELSKLGEARSGGGVAPAATEQLNLFGRRRGVYLRSWCVAGEVDLKRLRLIRFERGPYEHLRDDDHRLDEPGST
jgi:hypothetical protein